MINNTVKETNDNIIEMDERQKKLYKNRWWILGVIVSQPFMACIDGSIVNVALPTIRENLGITMSSAEWIVSSYLIAISATILIFGRLGDMKSKSKVFLDGILAFTFGSLLCSLSPNIEILVVSRIIQAIGAAMVMSTNQGIITDVFPPSERGKALGISGSFVALGSILGPALGGGIITYLSWNFIFLINIPIGIIAYIMGRKILPVRKVVTEEKLDVKGAVLFVTSILFFFSALLLSQNLGFKNIFIIGGFILGVILFGVFLKVESTVQQPMLDLSLFKERTFSINLVAALIIFITTNTINVIQPFYLTDILHFTPGNISLIMLADPLVLLFIAPISGALSDKIGGKKLTLFGLFGIACVIFGMSFLNANTSTISIVLLLCLMGFSSGVFNSPNTSLVMSSVPKSKLGIAGGTNALVRNLGLSLGASLSTTLLYSKMSSVAGYRVLESVPGKEHIFISGMKFVYIVIGLLCLGAFVLSLSDKILSDKKRT